MTDQPYDQKYWGPGGIDLSRWGNSCKRGVGGVRSTNGKRRA